jgi:predicted nucleic acid-binding protein
MIFVDANVFVYAFLSPQRKLEGEAVGIKKSAKNIVRRIEEGEQVATSLVHVSEVANVLEEGMTAPRLSELLRSILGRDNILTLEPTADDYLLALDLAPELGIGPNDALAVVLMRRNGISSIYSFDKHFQGIEGIERLTS